MYIDELDDIVNKHDNTCSTIKMKPLDVKSGAYIKELMKMILNLKLVILLEYQNIKMSWLKMNQIDYRKKLNYYQQKIAVYYLGKICFTSDDRSENMLVYQQTFNVLS